MKRSIIRLFSLVGFILLTTFSLFAQSSSCADKIFSINKDYSICRAEVLGKWKVDSMSDGISSDHFGKLKSCTNNHIWNFYPSGDLYVDYTLENGDKARKTCSVTFYDGLLMQLNINSNGYKVETPEKYEVWEITDKRMVVVLICNQNLLPCFKYILSRVK